jgi:hypothetical protein
MTAATLARPAAPVLACAAGCGVPMHPAAAAGGFDRHPCCEPDYRPGQPATAWACLDCPAAGPARGDQHAVTLIRQHAAAGCRPARRGRA